MSIKLKINTKEDLNELRLKANAVLLSDISLYFKLVDQGVKSSKLLGNQEHHVRFLISRLTAHRKMGDAEEARNDLAKIEDIVEKLPEFLQKDPPMRAYNPLALTFYVDQSYEQALTNHIKALELAQLSDNRKTVATIHGNYVNTLSNGFGDNEGAIRYVKFSYRIFAKERCIHFSVNFRLLLFHRLVHTDFGVKVIQREIRIKPCYCRFTKSYL